MLSRELSVSVPQAIFSFGFEFAMMDLGLKEKVKANRKRLAGAKRCQSARVAERTAVVSVGCSMWCVKIGRAKR
jgi:hypothetical protein